MKNTIIQFIKFCIIGVFNTLINLVVLYLFTDIFGFYYMFSAVIAFLVAVTNSFIFNKLWTFEEKLNHKVYFKSIKFIVVSVIALLINLVILYVLVEYFKMWYMAAQLVGIATNLIINFIGNKLWTFQK